MYNSSDFFLWMLDMDGSEIEYENVEHYSYETAVPFVEFIW